MIKLRKISPGRFEVSTPTASGLAILDDCNGWQLSPNIRRQQAAVVRRIKEVTSSEPAVKPPRAVEPGKRSRKG